MTMSSNNRIKVSLEAKEKSDQPCTLQSCEEMIIKSYTGLNEAEMNKAASGKIVFSYSFGTCVAVIAKLTEKDGPKFAVFHSTFPDLEKTDLGKFISRLNKGIAHGKKVEIVYTVRKSDAEKSKANSTAAPFVLHALRKGLTDPKITMKRLDIEAYDGVLCDADKNLIIIAQKFTIDCDKTLGVAEEKDAHCTYEARGVGKDITIVPEDDNENLAYQMQAGSPKGKKLFPYFTPTPTPKADGDKSPTLLDFPDVGTASSMSSAPASSPAPASGSDSAPAPAADTESDIRTGSPVKKVNF